MKLLTLFFTVHFFDLVFWPFLKKTKSKKCMGPVIFFDPRTPSKKKTKKKSFPDSAQLSILKFFSSPSLTQRSRQNLKGAQNPANTTFLKKTKPVYIRGGSGPMYGKKKVNGKCVRTPPGLGFYRSLTCFDAGYSVSRAVWSPDAGWDDTGLRAWYGLGLFYPSSLL